MENIKKHKLTLPLIITIVVAFVAFFVGAYLDRDISKGIHEKYELGTTWFPVIFTVLGPIVTCALGTFAGTCMFITPERKSHKLTVFIRIIGILLIIAITGFAYISGEEYAELAPNVSIETRKVLKIVLVIVLLALDSLVIFLTMKFTKELDQEKLFWVAVVIALILAINAGASEVVKYLASRPRPRTIYLDGGLKFRAWYEWQPFVGFSNSECKSFVSGHSSNAAGLMVIIPLLLSLTKFGEKKYAKYVGFGIGALWTLVLVVSRMLGLAHFLTDVAGGVILSAIIEIVILNVFPLVIEKAQARAQASNK